MERNTFEHTDCYITTVRYFKNSVRIKLMLGPAYC